MILRNFASNRAVGLKGFEDHCERDRAGWWKWCSIVILLVGTCVISSRAGTRMKILGRAG